MKKAIFILLSLVVLALLFRADYRTGQQRRPLVLSPDTIYQTDTCWREAPPVIKEVPVPVPQEVDTPAILAAHFKKRIYNDTLVNDNRLSLAVTDTVFQNRLWGRTAVYTLKTPAHERVLSLGLTAGYRSIALMAGYRNNRTEYLLGYDMFNRAFLVGAKFDLARW